MTDTYYDSIASGYDALHGDEQLTKLRLLHPYVKKWFEAHTTLLDVGCGTGISTDFWTQFDCETTGIDPSKGLLAQNTTGKSKLSQAPAEKIPFENSSFDIVVSFTAIQNFTDIKQGLLEMKRVGREQFLITCLAKSAQVEDSRKCIAEIFGKSRELTIDKDIAWIVDLSSKSL